MSAPQSDLQYVPTLYSTFFNRVFDGQHTYLNADDLWNNLGLHAWNGSYMCVKKPSHGEELLDNKHASNVT